MSDARPDRIDEEGVRGTAEGVVGGPPSEEQISTPPPDVTAHVPDFPVPPVTDDPIVGSVLSEDWGRMPEEDEGTVHGSVTSESSESGSI